MNLNHKEKYHHVHITTGDPVKTIKILLGFLALLATLLFATSAMANHPDDDIFDRDVSGQPPPPVIGWDDPVCDEGTLGEIGGNPNGQWGSMDGQIWECMPDPGIPGVPGSAGKYWEPRPNVPGGADVAYTRRWDPINVPGFPGAYVRLGSRTEWVNPYNKAPATSAPPQGSCPTVAGGCKFKGGGDIRLVKADGTPLNINKTWFNHALQVYVYNATTKIWEKKNDTGWMMNATGPTLTNKMTGTYNYGTAPYGAAWYYVRAWARVWNGSAWAPTVSQDPKTATGTLDMVWDDPPGSTESKPAKPTKAPKVEKVKKAGFIQPTPSEPVETAVATPAETP